MSFDLSQVGNRKFVTTRVAKPNWNEGVSVMVASEKNFMFSKQFCEDFNITDNALLSFFFKKDGVYLANLTGYEIPASERLNVSQTIKQGEFKSARTARNSKLRVAFNETANLPLSEYTIDTSWTKDEDVQFPLVKLMLLTAEDEVAVENDTNEVDNSGDLVSQPNTTEVF